MVHSIREKILAFVKQHDLNPTNKVAENIPEAQVTEGLADSFNKMVIKTLPKKDAAELHQANEVLFEYLPPNKRDQFLSWLQKSCRQNSSAFCHPEQFSSISTLFLQQDCNFLKMEESVQCKKDKLAYESEQQVRDLSQIPAISESNFPNIYQKINWYIDHARKIGETEIADGLERSLKAGKLKYLPELKKAKAYADPRDLGVIVFGKGFFEETWGDRTRGLDGKKVQISDQEVLEYANNFSIIRFQDINELTTASITIPSLKPETIRKKLAEETPKNQKEHYKGYFGTLPTNTFPKDMPFWVILLGHEYRHTMQMSQDQTSWQPAWARRISKNGLAYYTTLMRYNSSLKMNHPEQSTSNGQSGKLEQEGEVRARMEKVASSREREATDFGVAIALKLKPHWKSIPKLKN